MNNTDKRLRLATTTGPIKRIHVDQRRVRAGQPAITVQTSAGPLKASRVDLDGPLSFVHQADKPLSCGAKLWIETTAAIKGEWTS